MHACGLGTNYHNTASRGGSEVRGEASCRACVATVSRFMQHLLQPPTQALQVKHLQQALELRQSDAYFSCQLGDNAMLLLSHVMTYEDDGVLVIW
jgi:hypothetical protein